MARGNQSLIYLDTHIVVWLYAGLIKKLTGKAKKKIDECDVHISQMVRLELQYLYEIGRIKVKPATIIKSLSKSIDLKIFKKTSERPYGNNLPSCFLIAFIGHIIPWISDSKRRVKYSFLISNFQPQGLQYPNNGIFYSL